MSQLIKIQDFAELDLVQTQEVCNAIKTFEQLHSIEMPTLTYMISRHTEDSIIALIELKIMVCLEFFNLKMTMTDEQIKKTAELILDDYQWLTIPDVDMCFKSAMKGQYGKLYAAIDGQVILGWFTQYSKDRSNAMEELSLRQHYELKKKKEIHPDIVQAFKKVQFERSEKPKPPVLQPSVVEKRAWEVFKYLDKKQGKSLPGTNFPVVKVGGRHYSIDDFTAFYFKRISDRKKLIDNPQ